MSVEDKSSNFQQHCSFKKPKIKWFSEYFLYTFIAFAMLFKPMRRVQNRSQKLQNIVNRDIKCFKGEKQRLTFYINFLTLSWKFNVKFIFLTSLLILYVFIELAKLSQSTTLSFGVQNDRIIFDLSTENSGYIAFALAPGTSMANSEIVSLTRNNGEILLFEYEGQSYGNGKPRTKTENGVWQIDHFSDSEFSVRVSRSASPSGCSICKSINDEVLVQYAIATSSHTTAGAIRYHGWGSQKRGSVGRYRLADIGRKKPYDQILLVRPI